MEIKEFEIPVPWGHIAVKAWGYESLPAVLTVHGVGDNAGSFDRLIPLLPQSFCYICIDLPGHGHSSRFPSNSIITGHSMIYSLKLVIDYLNRGTYIFMGHSWGGDLMVYFSQIYPEYVRKVITLDALYVFRLRNFEDFTNIRTRLESFIKTCDNLKESKRPSYSYQEAKIKLNEKRYVGGLNEEAMEVLLKRSLIYAENGKFQFNTDPRLNCVVNVGFDIKYSSKVIKRYPIQCPLLLIISEAYRPLFNSVATIFNALQQSSRNFSIKFVDGNHDVHINTPETVAPIINNFLSSDSKL